MTLVDTSVWVAHFRVPDVALARQLDEGAVCTHPYVIGEIALGQLRQRDIVLKSLKGLPLAAIATEKEVLAFI